MKCDSWFCLCCIAKYFVVVLEFGVCTYRWHLFTRITSERSIDLRYSFFFIHKLHTYGVDLELANGEPMVNLQFLCCYTTGTYPFRNLVHLAPRAHMLLLSAKLLRQ